MLLVEQGCSQDFCKWGAHHYGVLHKPGYTYGKEIIGERAKRDTLSRSSMENVIRIYIYIYRYVRHSLVARSWGDVMWEELSVSHFLNIVSIGNGH